jgi:phage-related protein
MPSNERPLEWIASSYKDLLDLPEAVRRLFGFALSLAQAGDKHDSAKVLKGFHARLKIAEAFIKELRK